MLKTILEFLSQAKSLVLDFDGTLVDSNAIKRNAFEKCFTNYPEHFEKIMAYCKTNNHIPRQVKFQHVFENILHQSYTSSVKKEILDIYAKHTTNQVIEADEVPGASKFLKHFFSKQDLALLSSTPHEILLTLLKKRGLKKYFKWIQGAPVHKATWLKKFLEDHGLQKNEVLFFGDSPEDLQASKESGIIFIAVGSDLTNQTDFHIQNFEALHKTIRYG